MRLDFKRVAAAALAQLPALCAQWLPDGRREGSEWKALNPMRADSRVGSFSINLDTGAWADFASDDRGGDAVSLYAYLFTARDQGRALRELAAAIGVTPAAGTPAAPAKRRTEWVPVVPASDAPAFRLSHMHYGEPSARWEYRTLAGELIGFVCRFDKADGGKEILPACWASNDAGERAWRWLSFPKPRPLYNLPALAAKPAAPVLVVEGEKTADAAARLFPHCVAVTWPGGAKAVKHADWAPLRGRTVVIWPDNDAPGIAAAQSIAALVPGARIVDVAALGKPEGWDLADALAEGAAAEDMQAFARAHLVAGTAPDPFPARAEVDDSAWRARLIYAGRNLKDCRENVIYVLREHPDWRGVLGVDTFSKRLVVRRRSPIGQPAGEEWSADADTRLCLWLQEQEHLLIRSLDTITQAVRHVALLEQFHPVREYLGGLQWDGRARADTWAARLLGAPDTQYTRLVGRFFLINLARRIFEPGCIMRSVPVLEGAQEKGKSTALRMLARPWFSDTTFRVGDKDAFLQIQGVWLYEISELESFNRAEASAVKAFVSSTEDNFRAPYERANERHARQTCFAATTNASEYLKDWTGNTRFWPLETGTILIDEIAEDRDQLLAEAVALYRQGERAFPTQQQAAQLFEPEQRLRMITHPWEEAIHDYCDTPWKTEVTAAQCLEHLGFKLDKLNPQGTEAQRVGNILKGLGWKKKRQSEGRRLWVWQRPSEAVAATSAAAREPGCDDEGDAHVPF